MLLWIFWTLCFIDIQPLAAELYSPSLKLELIKRDSTRVFGCRYLPQQLCTDDEICFDDGIFGFCSFREESPHFAMLSDKSLEELQSLLAMLDVEGFGWTDEYTQCIWNVFFQTEASSDDPIYDRYCALSKNKSKMPSKPQDTTEIDKRVPHIDARFQRRTEDMPMGYQVDNEKINLKKYKIPSSKEMDFTKFKNKPSITAKFKLSSTLEKKSDYMRNGKIDESIFHRFKMNIHHVSSPSLAEHGYIVTSVILCGALLIFAMVIVGIYCAKRIKYRNDYFKHEHESKQPLTDDPTSISSSSVTAASKTGLPSGDMDSLFGATDTYKEIFRQQRQELSDILKGGGTNNDSNDAENKSASWSEEPVTTNMDISTGHAILSYMEEHFCNHDKLEAEWQNVCAYEAEGVSTKEGGMKDDNKPKNRYIDVLPYDNNRVKLQNEKSDYINASKIVDDDPSHPLYIATQGPLATTCADFWRMIWEQDVYVIVNLTCLMEAGVPMCHKYWPDEGCTVFGNYEVHLVSEHVWCEAYLVRSFYIKNRFDGQTRTITQFHLVCWPDLDVPQNCRLLLDFRRKVNKSFRNRNSPIVVHCNDGCGRTGTYILLDMIINRLNKGVKEVDVAATLEHIRDQRCDMVKTMEQFQFVLTAIAEEVQETLKAISNQ